MLYLAQLLLTIVIESGGALLLRRFAGGRSLFPDVILLNLFSHPLAHLLYDARILDFAGVELLVILVEALGYRLVTRLSWGRAIFFSVVLNGLTVAASFLL